MNIDWQVKIKDFWLKYETKIILVTGFFLIAILSFEGGYLKGKSLKNSPVVIEKAAAEAQNCDLSASSADIGKSAGNTQNNKKECLFVASKNSTKYHTANCTWAKRIKPENLVCFSSQEAAAQSGRQPDGTCIK